MGNARSVEPAARLLWILIILATLYFSYFHNLGAIGLVGPDEPRYAWIARDMVESGDWVTPRLYGKPWFEKPVLYYWGAALSFKCFGVSDAAARLPSAMAALFATLAMGWLAWRVYGGETARWLLLLLPTTVGMIGFSHAAATDMPFAGMLTVAMVCAALILGLVQRDEGSPGPRIGPLVLFGFFLGLAVLAKGPAAILLSGGAVLLWAILTRRWRDALRCFHPFAIVSFCVTALPWYVLCARRNPDFFRVFIIEHNFKRYLTPEFQHIQPFWFYIPVVLIAFLPWTLILVWGGALGAHRIRRNGQIGSTTILLLSWAGFCLVFFSISKSKLPGYILPAIPAIALLLSRAYVVFSIQSEKSLHWTLSTYSFVSLLAGVALIALGKRIYASPQTGQAMIVAGCVALAFALANLLLTLKARAFPVAALCVIPVFLLIALFGRLSHPWLAYDLSGKTLAIELAAAHIPKEQIYAVNMKRGQLYSLSFYLHREISQWVPNQTSPGYLLVPSRRCRDFVGPSLTCSDSPIELGRSAWFAYHVERRAQ
jgi:4-amino-4-deoxy-L-arabinose transferase-like glycosyltransferase